MSSSRMISHLCCTSFNATKRIEDFAPEVMDSIQPTSGVHRTNYFLFLLSSSHWAWKLHGVKRWWSWDALCNLFKAELALEFGANEQAEGRKCAIDQQALAKANSKPFRASCLTSLCVNEPRTLIAGSKAHVIHYRWARNRWHDRLSKHWSIFRALLLVAHPHCQKKERVKEITLETVEQRQNLKHMKTVRKNLETIGSLQDLLCLLQEELKWSADRPPFRMIWALSAATSEKLHKSMLPNFCAR